ncbi:hypothetical protein [Eisenbergiella tayi]|uniref:hypothetical protein n=1 Tax=Eisenbergiella tayi TaxID=1432052 RepID=UPI0008485AC2|nr:hypothetical protein [Eisenbergiella tayi]ODR35483.1 hypothetical protein BEI60_16270 [Eisenbergiella tayi]
MFVKNKEGTRAIMPINDFANICGYFYNAAFNNFNIPTPNNGYNCKHPNCDVIEDGYGCCYTFSCPLGWEADDEECNEFGLDYEEGEFIVTEDRDILDKLLE